MHSARSLFALTILAAVAIATIVSETSNDVITAVATAYVAVKAWAVTTLELFAGPAQPRAPQLTCIRARAFVARLVKRERPLVTASWRMCPPC